MFIAVENGCIQKLSLSPFLIFSAREDDYDLFICQTLQEASPVLIFTFGSSFSKTLIKLPQCPSSRHSLKISFTRKHTKTINSG